MDGHSRCDPSDKGKVRSTIHNVFVDMCYLPYAAYPYSSLECLPACNI